MYRALTGRSVFYLWYPLEPLLCLPPNWWVLCQSRHWHSRRFAGWLYQRSLLLTRWVTKKGIMAVTASTEESVRRASGQLCVQILRSWTSLGLTSPKMWCHPVGLDPGIGSDHVTYLTVGCGRVFSGMVQAFTGASKTWSTERDSAGVGCIWVRGPWWNWLELAGTWYPG